MSVLILGHEGNMGLRYRRILEFLGVEWYGLDLENGQPPTKDSLRRAALDAQSILIATPTPAHAFQICALADFDVPILCEKPLATDQRLIDLIFETCDKMQTNLSMIFQYQTLLEGKFQTDVSLGTHYNYFKHGNDTLPWDCIQILGLHKGNVEDVGLFETSPIWDCVINGNRLNPGEMDLAYVTFIKRWLQDPGQDLDFIKQAHDRVFQWKKRKAHGSSH